MIRELVSYIPQNNRDDAPVAAALPIPSTGPIQQLDTLVPVESNIPYDIKDIIHRVVDDGEFFEIHEHWAKNIVIGFARMDGRSVGHRGQSACLSGRLPGHQLLGQRRALRALLRRLQYSDSDL